MRVSRSISWSTGPFPPNGVLQVEDVTEIHYVPLDDVAAKIDRHFVGAQHGEERRGAFRGPTWTWEGDDGQFLIVSNFSAIEDEDGRDCWGEAELTADCSLDRILGLWNALIADGAAVWAVGEPGETLLGPDAFAESCG